MGDVLRLLHVSDTHGFPERFDAPDDVRLIVHSGDLLPNGRWPNTPSARAAEVRWQAAWVRDNVDRLAALIGYRTFLFTPGNHDFGDICSLLRRAGVDAWNLWHDGPRVIDGVRFVGMPFVPWMGGHWNHERPEEEIAAHFAELLDEHRPDVVVAHCPPLGAVDIVWESCGSRARRIGSQAVSIGLLNGKGHRPRWYLCGHCHEAGGQEVEFGGVRVSNAATVQRIVEVRRG